MNSGIKKEDYYREINSLNSSTNDYLLNRRSIKYRFCLEFDINWKLEEFINEFDEVREDCGPFVEQDYNSETGKLVETNCYNSQSAYLIFLGQLDKVFRQYWSEYVDSDFILQQKMSEFSYYNWLNNGNNFPSIYIKIGWEYLSKSDVIPYSSDLIQKFKSNWHWGLLLRNNNVNWTIEMLSLFNEEIDNFTWENDFEEEMNVDLSSLKGKILSDCLQ